MIETTSLTEVKPHESAAGEPAGAIAQPRPPRRVWHFLRHLIEMFVAMVIGMVVGAWIFLSVAGGLTPPQGMTRHPVAFVVVMAFSMTAPMVGWMRLRGHGGRSCREMTLAMVLPAALIVILYWLSAISAPLCGLYCTLSTIAMLALMGFRRHDYGM